MQARVPAVLSLLLFAAPVSAILVGDRCAPTPVVIGVNSDFNAQLSRNAQLGWVRINMRWREINPAQGVWDFNLHDAKVNAARAQGLQILGILSTAPQWAGGGSKGNRPPTNINLWRQFVRQVAQRYQDDVIAYEVWNEPDLRNNNTIGVGWDRPLSQFPKYSDYLRVAAQQIRTRAPGTLVVGGVTSDAGSRTREVYQQIENTGSSQYVDVISFHANGKGASLSSVISGIQSRLSIIDTHNPSNAGKPMWITEMGWRSGGIGEAQQQSRIQSLISSLRGHFQFTPLPGGDSFLNCGGFSRRNLSHVFIFFIQDHSNETAGIYRQNGTPKPVVTNYLATKPFPATEVDSLEFPFTTSCVGRTCTFTSTFNDPFNQFDFRWDFGDGTVIETGFNQVTHTFASSGWHFVKSLIFEEHANPLDNLVSEGGSLELIDVP